jgi:hypothetical protein
MFLCSILLCTIKSSTETLLRTVVLRKALVDTRATGCKTQQLSLKNYRLYSFVSMLSDEPVWISQVFQWLPCILLICSVMYDTSICVTENTEESHKMSRSDNGSPVTVPNYGIVNQ